uniref:Uncharacterized protein n=1 Tax=Arundo donax TaxID=35708 RepID=A0A0A8YHF9_ARUDO
MSHPDYVGTDYGLLNIGSLSCLQGLQR